MEGFGDWVSLVGTILAFATPLFLIYDRVLRKPEFTLQAKPRARRDNYLFVRIKNTLDHDILIENWSITPPLVGLATGDSEREIGDAMVGDIPTMIVPPLSEFMLPLIILGPATGRHFDQITIRANWTSTTHSWPFPRHIKIKTTVAKLKTLQAAQLGQEPSAEAMIA